VLAIKEVPVTATRAERRDEPRDALNRERVLRAAMELADESGIESLTMRELGRRLGVEAASLYNHVASRDDLLDGMTDLAAGEIDVPSDAPGWKDAMRRRAASAREVFSRHPWASALMDSREHSGPAQLSYADRVLGTLLGAGFSPRAAANAWLVIDSYVYGFQRQQSSLALPEGVDASDVAEEMLTTIQPDAYPSLMRIAGDFATDPHDEAAVFDFGLDLILDGLQRSLESN
jgi:AcrR family transcriptional regulator